MMGNCCKKGRLNSGHNLYCWQVQEYTLEIDTTKIIVAVIPPRRIEVGLTKKNPNAVDWR